MSEFKKYVFRKYSKKFPALFNKEKQKLKKILGKDAIIEHCGSTAVPGLGGKGLIDIFISVKREKWKSSGRKLRQAGYLFFTEAGNDERQFFERDYKYSKKTRRVHLHLTFNKNSEFKKAVAFVKYLRAHQELVREYEKIKKEAIKKTNGEGKIYRKHKKAFIENTTKKALKESGYVDL